VREGECTVSRRLLGWKGMESSGAANPASDESAIRGHRLHVVRVSPRPPRLSLVIYHQRRAGASTSTRSRRSSTTAIRRWRCRPKHGHSKRGSRQTREGETVMTVKSMGITMAAGSHDDVYYAGACSPLRGGAVHPGAYPDDTQMILQLPG
jgi:hypothetical protein